MQNNAINLTNIYFKTIMKRQLRNDGGIVVELHPASYNMNGSFTKRCQREIQSKPISK